MSEYPDDQCERTIQAWIKSNKALESERDALKAELLEVRVQASKGWYTPQKEAELERTKAELHHSRTLAKGLAEAARQPVEAFQRMSKDHYEKTVLNQTLQSATENWDSLLQEPLQFGPLSKALAAYDAAIAQKEPKV